MATHWHFLCVRHYSRHFICVPCLSLSRQPAEAYICHHHTGIETKTAQRNVTVRGRRWNPGLCSTFCLLSSSHGWNDRSWESCRLQHLWSQTCYRRYQASEAKGGVSSSPMLLSISPLRSRSYILSKLIGQPCQFPYVLWWKWDAIPLLPVLCSLSSFKSSWHALVALPVSTCLYIFLPVFQSYETKQSSSKTIS